MESSFLSTEMPEGVLGAIARRIPGQIIEPVNVKDASVDFGFPLIMGADGLATGVTSAGATFKPADFYGVCLRTFPVRETENGKPNPKLTQGCVRKGYVFMKQASTDTTVLKDGMPVFVVAKTAGKHKVLGEVVGTADGDNCVQIDANFLGASDSNKIVAVGVRI